LKDRDTNIKKRKHIMGQQQEMVAGSNPLLRRVVLALSLVATLLAAMAGGGSRFGAS